MAVVVSTIESMDVQVQVDEYLELHAEMAVLKKRMDDLKKGIRSHMDEKGLTSIEGSHGKQVYLQNAKASNSTSRYTDYELKDVMHILGDDLKKVTEIRVNAEKLEGLMTMVSPEVKQKLQSKKIVKEGTPRFTVKN